MNYDVAIIGGGVIGLACAWRLAQAGARVGVFERGQAGHEASWAAAGMLAAQTEAVHHAPDTGGDIARIAAMFELCLESRTLYAAFAAELLDATGVDIELSLSSSERGDWRKPGILYVADALAPQTRRTLEAQQTQGLRVEERWWHGQRALWLPDEGQVDNRKLGRALRLAAQNAGATIHENTPVQQLNLQGLRGEDLRGNTREMYCETTGFFAAGENIACAKVLLCAGAWSSQIANLPTACVPPVFPTAGQLLAMRSHRQLPHILYGEGVYLVPRRNGRLIVGATMENKGFRKRPTPDGALRLLGAATALVPELKECVLLEHWAGLRPNTPDGLPILGRTPLKNLFVATGHYRNGILLTPVTAKVMADCILNDAPINESFGIARFCKSPDKAKVQDAP